MAFARGSSELKFPVKTEIGLDAFKTGTITYVATATRCTGPELDDLIAATNRFDLRAVAEFARTHMKRWDEFVDVEGKSADFDEENLQQFLDHTAMPMSFAASYIDAIRGKAKRGN